MEKYSTNKQIMCPPGVGILDYLQKKGFKISAPCGGTGTCGKCIIQVRGGALPVTDADKAFLSGDRINEGYRLACRAIPSGPVRIEIKTDEEDFYIPVAAPGEKKEVKKDAEKEKLNKEHSFFAAFDIGTTAIAGALIDADEEKTVAVASRMNSQRAFGSDVVSRQKASIAGQGEALKNLVTKDLAGMITELTNGGEAEVSYICIAANTTMQHLLMEYDCKGIASWPFTPVSLGETELKAHEVFGGMTASVPGLSENAVIDMIPGVSAYVGGDVTSGMLEYCFPDSDETVMFIDMGTNAELALLHEGNIITASAAAGPAFEGAGLKCGTGSVPGAISGVEYCPDRSAAKTEGWKPVLKITTIGDAPPAGICGTGVIEAVAAFLDAGIIDRHGTLSRQWFDRGFVLGKDPEGNDIYLDQEDIRQIQMAKGAIRAGADALLKNAGLTWEDTDKIILAGGFGSFIDPSKAVRIGLLARGTVSKCVPAGNAALKGAVSVCLGKAPKADRQAASGIQDAADIAEKACHYELAQDEYFKQRYIECMEFPDDNGNVI